MKIIFNAAIFFLAVSLVCISCSKKQPVASVPLTDYETMRLQVVKEVQQGTIKLDSSGVADLPGTEQTASTDGKIYGANSADKGWLVAFNLTFGNTTKEQFLLYAEKGTFAPNEVVSVGSFKLIVTEKVRPNWYNVVTQ